MTSSRNQPSKISSRPSATMLSRLLIRASAGTGKTFQLSSRYIALMRQSAPERILASTFTRKAAGEILERILLRLARSGTQPQALKELSDSIATPELTQTDCLLMLAQLTRQLHRVRISTLDAFFAQLAGSHALELGFPSGWRILDPVEVEQLKAQALEQMLREGNQQDLVQLMHMLDKGESSRSVSGLMQQTIQDLYYVFLDSPQAAWDRFPEYRFLGEEERELLLSDMLRVPVPQKRMLTAVEGDALACREGRWEDFQKKGLLPKVRSSTKTYYNVSIPDALCACYERLGEHALAMAAAAWKQQTTAAWTLLQGFHTVFARLKQAAGGLEFGDVTRQLSRSQNAAERRKIHFRMDGAIEHLLLDEFQDTSRPQWEVIRPFAEEACRDPHGTFFCVGDTKQAIYGWRGGVAAIFDTIEQQLPGLQAQPLNLSYRSSPVVIDAVNQAMTGLRQHNNLEEHAELLHRWCSSFPHHETTRQRLTGYACLKTGPAVADSATDSPPATQEESGDFWEFAARYVARLVAEAPGASVGVLTRKNATVGRMIFELSRLGIAASEEGGNPLTDSAAVQLILSLMNLADHPGNTVAVWHVARSPLGRTLSFPDPADAAAVSRFSHEMRSRLLREGYGPVVHQLALALAPVCNAREYRRAVQLAELADRFDQLFSTLRPTQFVRYAESQRCEEPSDALVRVMTVHQSKGLEFDIVVLPELGGALLQSPRYVTGGSEPGAAPELVALYRSEEYFQSIGGEFLAARQQTRDRMLQEALCVLYVAMTRAVRSLHMLIPCTVYARHPKTFAGLLQAALAPAVPFEPLKTLWELGDPDWAAAENPSGTPNAPTPDTAQPAEPAPICFAPTRGERQLQRVTPSGQKSLPEVAFPHSVVSSGMSGKERGTLYHRWLQEIAWIDDAHLPLDALVQAAQELGYRPAQIEEQLTFFQQCLQSAEISQLLNRSQCRNGLQSVRSSAEDCAEELRTELPVLLQTTTGELLQGCLDRVVIFREGQRPVAAVVIDFKTDNAAQPADLQLLVNHYRGQMRAYRDALCRLLKLKPEQVLLKLAFLTTGQVVIVD